MWLMWRWGEQRLLHFIYMFFNTLIVVRNILLFPLVRGSLNTVQMCRFLLSPDLDLDSLD